MKSMLAFLVLVIISACASNQEAPKTETAAATSSIEKNKEIVRRLYTDLVNQRKYSLIDSFYAPGIVDHGALEGQEQGREGFKKAVTEFLGIFSTVEVTLHDIVAEGNLVATRETWKATMSSDNKVLDGETLHIFGFKDGLITDEWHQGWEKWLPPSFFNQ